MNEKFILCFLALLAALLQSIIIYNYLKMFFKKKANTKNTIVIAIFAVTTFSSFLTTIIVTPSFITACITLV
ncbi:hypothetical protein, partial [Bombilactobacillus bombi]|uniref:hypothetical protein n=1 Tax=Bombilactobacillus bombi TaxID=1303590 RepID=UPI0015E59E26